MDTTGMNSTNSTTSASGRDLMLDTATGFVGELMGQEGPYLLLRPLNGGREWDAKPEQVRPATNEEAMHAKVAAANRASRNNRH